MGEAGLGKTTFVNSLFQQNFGEDKEYKTAGYLFCLSLLA
jgi:septin family protein